MKEHSKMTINSIAKLGGVVMLWPALTYASDLPSFLLPAQCTLGQTCFIQNYQDHDPTTGVRDYHCGSRTYDTHNGTDFRIPDMAVQKRGVSVLSVADGVVDRLRDGMQDISVR